MMYLVCTIDTYSAINRGEHSNVIPFSSPGFPYSSFFLLRPTMSLVSLQYLWLFVSFFPFHCSDKSGGITIRLWIRDGCDSNPGASFDSHKQFFVYILVSLATIITPTSQIMAEKQKKSLTLFKESIQIPSTTGRSIVADDDKQTRRTRDTGIDLLSHGMLKLYTICSVVLISTIMSGYSLYLFSCWVLALDTRWARWPQWSGYNKILQVGLPMLKGCTMPWILSRIIGALLVERSVEYYVPGYTISCWTQSTGFYRYKFGRDKMDRIKLTRLPADRICHVAYRSLQHFLGWSYSRRSLDKSNLKGRLIDPFHAGGQIWSKRWDVHLSVSSATSCQHDSHDLTKLPLGSLIAICGTSLVSIARDFGMSLTGRGLLGIAVGMFQPGKGLILIRQQYDQGWT